MELQQEEEEEAGAAAGRISGADAGESGVR